MNNEDMSDMFGKIDPDMVNNLINMINTSSTNSHTNNASDSSNSQNSSLNNDGIDFETILKMKKIIDSMNTKDDPRSNLLQSLKPYLNQSRQSKIDQYIQLMNMSKVLEVFPFIGGDPKKNDK